MHTGMLRERNDCVLDKYEIVKRLGEGSMGSVSLVRVKDSARGGSAFKHKKKGLFGNVKTSRKGSITEKRAVQVDYALKTIIISRVSPEFVDELKNEIALLKQMDTEDPIIVTISTVAMISTESDSSKYALFDLQHDGLHRSVQVSIYKFK